MDRLREPIRAWFEDSITVSSFNIQELCQLLFSSPQCRIVQHSIHAYFVSSRNPIYANATDSSGEKTPIYTMMFPFNILFLTHEPISYNRASSSLLHASFLSYHIIWSVEGSITSTTTTEQARNCFSTNSLAWHIDSGCSLDCSRLFHQRDVQLCWDPRYYRPIIAREPRTGCWNCGTSPEMIGIIF